VLRALEQLRGKLPLQIADSGAGQLVSTNPANPDEVVALAADSSRADADAAIERASAGRSWPRLRCSRRANHGPRPTPTSARRSIVNEEVFDPVLSSERVDSVEAAVALIESGAYGLTGGLFSRSPSTIDMVSRRGIVGNLYVNREITGAMVGRQPFGGGRMSGTGPKAGGPDYLLQFVEARSLSENTVRHGLVI
jgi:delta 1-pyrroline-5-carboxylate dehydrogenase